MRRETGDGRGWRRLDAARERGLLEISLADGLRAVVRPIGGGFEWDISATAPDGSVGETVDCGWCHELEHAQYQVEFHGAWASAFRPVRVRG